MRKLGDFFFSAFQYDFKRGRFLHILVCIVLSGTMSSCNWFRKERASSEQLVRDEIKNINWNEVDQYPLFGTCDETAGKEQQKQCFENTFIQHLYAGIEDQQVMMHGSVDDTIYVRFLISGSGQVSISEIERSDRWKKLLPNLDSIVNRSLEKMPELYPALKRNVPVATKYRLPIVLNTAVSSPADTP